MMNNSNLILAMNNALSTRTVPPARHRGAQLCARSLAVVVSLAALLLVSCKKGDADAKPADVDYYTCTMHPSVKKQNPTDKCPICSMDLVPVKKREVTAPERPSIETSHVRNTPDTPPSTLHAQHGVGAVRESEAQPAEFTVP